MAQQFAGSLEENVLTMLCWSEQHASTILMQVDPDLFSTRYFREIASRAVEYYDRYGKPPGVHLRDLMEERLRSNEHGQFFRRVFDKMEEIAEKLNPDYVLGKLNEYIELRQYQKLIDEAADAAHAGNLDAVRAALSQQPTQRNNSPGIWLSDADRMLAFMERRDEDFFSSGVDTLDDLGVRPARKTMFMFIAPPKKGKSWFCVEAGKRALLHRHQVLHITLENSEELTAQRYIQSLFAMSREQGRVQRIAAFERDEGGLAAHINFRQIDAMAISQDSRPTIMKKLRRLRKARLLIKEFASGSLSIPQLNGYLDMLERNENFVPDLLIVDYPDLMTLDAAAIRVDTGRTFVGLRGVAVQRNLALVVPTQGNRSSADAQVVHTRMVAEDWSKIMTADTVCTYSQTAAEKEYGLARILVGGARGVEDGFMVMISQSYPTGQFCLDSARMNAYLSDELGRLSGGERDEDVRKERDNWVRD